MGLEIGHRQKARIVMRDIVDVMLAVKCGAGSTSGQSTCDRGMQIDGVAKVRISLPGSLYAGPPEVRGFYARLLERVRALPGVDSAARDRWREGNVVGATRIGVLLSGRSFGADTVPVPLDPTIRLQVRRKRASSLILGTIGGLGLGVGLGAVSPPNTLGSWWGERTPGHRAEVIYFGLAGAVLGWTASWLFAPPSWQEVRLTPAGIASGVAPLNREGVRRARFGRLERWDTFSPTEDDFAAFFWAHRDSLHVIEGIWEQLPLATADDRMAIVRDLRYPGWEYVAVSLPRRRSMFLDQPRGRIVWALRRQSDAASFEIVEVENPNLARGLVREGVLRDDVLQLRTPLIEWARVRVAPPR